jgi:hypothetical protein
MLAGNQAFLLICDIQKRFRTTIYGFDDVVTVAKKLMSGASVLGVPIIGTEQYPKGTPDATSLIRT